MEIELARRGLWKGYFSLSNEKKLDKFALVWVDKDRRYFISNTSSLKPGIPYARERLIHMDDSTNADPVPVEFEINQPRVAERYYSNNLNIGESNRMRQDDFQLEEKLQTKDWSIKLILKSLEWMILIPTILVSIVSGGMIGTLQSSITISQRVLLTTGGLNEGHG